jgi:8-oxo-dGTP diphosphatase
MVAPSERCVVSPIVSDDVLGIPDGDFHPTLYALSAVVYAERGDQILLLKRAGGALEGQWFLPGGAVDPGERPEVAARRELLEESGLHIEGELELVGAYPIWVYGGDCLQLSYRGRVADGDVALSHEHDDQLWVDPLDMRALLTDEVIESIAHGDERVTQLVQGVRDDLHRYLAVMAQLRA